MATRSRSWVADLLRRATHRSRVFSGWWQRGIRELKGEKESVCWVIEAAPSLPAWQDRACPQ